MKETHLRGLGTCWEDVQLQLRYYLSPMPHFQISSVGLHHRLLAHQRLNKPGTEVFPKLQAFERIIVCTSFKLQKCQNWVKYQD